MFLTTLCKTWCRLTSSMKHYQVWQCLQIEELLFVFLPWMRWGKSLIFPRPQFPLLSECVMGIVRNKKVQWHLQKLYAEFILLKNVE